MHKHSTVVLVGIALACWGFSIAPRDAVAAPADAPAPSAVAAPAAAVVAAPPAAAATDFDGRMREVEAAEADTDFAKAIRLCQAMIADFKDSDQVKAVGETLRRLNEERKLAPTLAFAVQKLGAGDLQARQTGAQVLEGEGELGTIFLRHAFRTKEVSIAREAGLMLAKMGDTSSIPLFLDVLKTDPRSPLAEVASQGLVFMVRNMDKSVSAACFRLVQSDKGFIAARVVDVLETLFIRECKRDEKAFNEAAGHPDAVNVLRDYFGGALLSTNPAVVAWACERMRDVLPMRDGFRVRYYTNTEFKGVAVDRMESGVRLDLDRSLLTGGRSNDISVRWTTDVLVRQAGDHTVGVQATRDLPRTVQLWVDDKLVLELPPGVPDVGAAVTLETGWHKLRIDYVKQTGGVNAGDIGLTWAGPKVEGAPGAQVPQGPAVAFMHGPWPEEVAAMAKAATELGAKEYPVVKAARQRLAGAASLGRVFLLNVIEKQTGAARRQATDVLCDQVRQIESRRFPVLYNLAMAAEAEPVNPWVAILCSALWTKCDSDPERFNALVGAPDGYAKLKAHVEAALVSNDKAVVARACRDGSPFAPALPGLYARYFADADFSQLTTERLDAKVEVGKPQYPVPPDRQGRVSVEWNGWLVVGKTTTNTFGPDARGQAGFSVDGIGVGGNTTMRLDAGRHACRVEFRQGDTNAESWIRFNWSGPGIGGWAPVGPFNCAPWDSRLDALARAAKDLASGDTARIRDARAVLNDSAGVGLVYLRNEIRYGAAPEAASAATYLGGTRDKEAPPVLLARLKVEKDAAAIVALTDALGALAGVIDPKTFPELYKEALAEGAGEMNPYASILCAALWRVCGSDAKKFGTLVGDAEGYAKLETHVKAALVSKDQVAATRACRNGYPLAPLISGLRGRYYNDTSFVELVTDRRDLQIVVGNRQFPLPTNRQDNISAEWSGFLVIDKPGVYGFGADARNWAAFFVDELPVSGKMTLTNGVHTFRGAFVQNQPGGESWVSLNWSGPGFAAQPLAGALRCAPWDGKLEELVKAVTDLASPKALTARAARTVLTEAGDVGLVYARNAVRHGAAPEAAAAATFLGGTRDKDAPPVLLARLKEEKDAAAIVALTDALGALAGVIAPKTFPELYKEALAEGVGVMNPYASILCAALWRVCGSDAAKFGALVGDAGGYAKLDAHVKAALASKDQAAVARACRTGYPLAPSMQGLRGRYFDDPEFLKLAQERLDGRIEVENRQFPLPTNRQDNISAEWSGWLLVPQAGEYAFQVGAVNYGGLYIDGQHVNTGNWQESRKVKLDAGPHELKVFFVQNQPGGESRVTVYWERPGVQRQPLGGAMLACAPWEGKLAELGKAVADLPAADPARMSGLRETLVYAGEVGRVYLRNAVRDATAPVATAAANLLTEYRDKPAVSVMAAQFAIEKDAVFSAALLENLCEMAGEIDPKTLTEMVQTGLAQDAAAMNPRVRILCAALVACGGSPETFNKLVNNPNGYALLQKHVQTALASDAPEKVRAACRYGAPFAPALPGFVGRYYRGQDFRDLAIEKFDPQINIPNRQFPYPDGRQDNISARWTGLLRIEKPGDYTFVVNAQGGANVWVDGRHVAASAQGTEQKKDAVKLSPGVHKVRVDVWQASGNNQVQLQWVPPGGARDWIPSGLLMGVPSDAILTQIEKAVAGLSSAKPDEVSAATDLLTRHGGLSLFFLGRALRSAPLAGVGNYVPPMVAMNDPSLTSLVLELRKTQPSVAATINFALESLAAKPDRRYAPWFYAVMKADSALQFPVSGKFLAKALQEVCANNEGRFNSEFAGGDAQGAATLKAYLGKLPK